MEALEVNAAAIATWEEALKAFPCPDCQRSEWNDPGLIESGHSLRSGAIYTVCRTCQPEHTVTSFESVGRCPASVATQIVKYAYPVRYRWEWVREYPAQVAVFDRADGSQVWQGTLGVDNGWDASSRIEELNLQWWRSLSDLPRHVWT